MIRKLFIALVLIAVSITVICMNSSVEAASPATSATFTLDNKGNFVQTQDAYDVGTSFIDYGLKSPADLCVNGNDMYVADKGNGRILIINSVSGLIVDEIRSFTVLDESFDATDTNLKKDGTDPTKYRFAQPSCICVSNIGDIYVGDEGSQAIFVFNSSWECINIIQKPTSNLYSSDSFKPTDIAVDNINVSLAGRTGGTLYIIVDGDANGLLRLTNNGDFMDYWVNRVRMEFLDYVQDLLFSDEAKFNQNIGKTPALFSGVCTDSEGMVYTTTSSDDDPLIRVQHHDAKGLNMFTKYPLITTSSMTDVTVDKNGVVYAISGTGGDIFTYTNEGEFICSFAGGSPTAPYIAGVFKQVSAIAVDNEMKVWVIDSVSNVLQTFIPTDYTLKIYDALNASKVADYETSIARWNEVLQLNQMSNIAHNNLGRDYFNLAKRNFGNDSQSLESYRLAMEHLKISNDKTQYSQAYWEVRNQWLQSNLTWILLTVVIVALLWFVIKAVDKRKLILDPIRSLAAKIQKNKVFSDYTCMFHIAKHPEDGFYYLKCEKIGSLRGAWMICITLFITYMFFITSQGFIYQYNDVTDIDFVSVIFGFVGILFVFVICNYLVTSITNGMGGVKEIFKLLMYSLAPIIIGMILIIILSHLLTEQEAFFLDVILYVTAIWSIILVCIGMQEVQGYSFKQLIISLLLTVLLICVIVLVALIITVMSGELFSFIGDIFEEVKRNVIG